MYPQDRVWEFVTEHCVPVKIHIKERSQGFGRFHVEWTPTLILAEADGTERHRSVGFLPTDDFLAQLQLGLGKAAFSRSRLEEAQGTFEAVASQYPGTGAAPEAVYWMAVSRYKSTGNPEFLKKGGAQLQEQYPQSDWAKKSSVWIG